MSSQYTITATHEYAIGPCRVKIMAHRDGTYSAVVTLDPQAEHPSTRTQLGIIGPIRYTIPGDPTSLPEVQVWCEATASRIMDAVATCETRETVARDALLAIAGSDARGANAERERIVALAASLADSSGRLRLSKLVKALELAQ